MRTISAFSVLIFFVFTLPGSFAQAPPPSLQGDQIVEGASPAVVLILSGTATGRTAGLASGLIVRSDGIVLTAYHAVRGAQAVRVQLKDGEIFDQVELLAFDERRDVAALRITGTGLPTLPTAALSQVQAGQAVYVISHAAALTWTASTGVVGAVRLADDVPGAGSGYRLVQFTAPVSPGSSGGALIDAQGRAVGIVTGTLSGGQNLNFAIPLESVLGLAQASGGTAFARGSQLRMPAASEPPPPNPAVPAPRGPDAFAPSAPPIQPVNPGGSELSQPIENRDPIQLLRNFKTIYIVSKTVWLKPELMQESMYKEPALSAWGLVVVSDPKVADVRLTVDRAIFTWTWTYELVHQNTGIVLGTGKYNAISGGAGASKITEAVVGRIAEARGAPPGVPDTKKK